MNKNTNIEQLYIADRPTNPFTITYLGDYARLATWIARSRTYARESHARAVGWAIAYKDGTLLPTRDKYAQEASELLEAYRYAFYATSALTIAILWLAHKLIG